MGKRSIILQDQVWEELMEDSKNFRSAAESGVQVIQLQIVLKFIPFQSYECPFYQAPGSFEFRNIQNDT